MIGQKNNINTLIQWRCNKSVPRFIIISGEIGSGRLTFAKAIMSMLHITGIISDCKIEDVRRTIEYAYEYTSPTVYIFRNADDMSLNAKNALLKVVEEPPNNAYFIMTVQNIDNMLGTIRSRGTVIKMEPYTIQDLQKVTMDETLLKYCTNIGILNTPKEKILRAEKCVDDVLEALRSKSGTKLLKATTQLKSKKTEEDKVDCLIFMRIFEEKLYDSYGFCSLPLCIIKDICSCRQELQRSSINKKASIESMLIKILEVIKNAKIS